MLVEKLESSRLSRELGSDLFSVDWGMSGLRAGLHFVCSWITFSPVAFLQHTLTGTKPSSLTLWGGCVLLDLPQKLESGAAREDGTVIYTPRPLASSPSAVEAGRTYLEVLRPVMKTFPPNKALRFGCVTCFKEIIKTNKYIEPLKSITISGAPQMHP